MAQPSPPAPISAHPAPVPPRERRRWLRIARVVVEVGLLVIAFGALLLWCSIPNTARLASENPTSTSFIDLRREQAASAGRPFALKWEWRPIGKISRYLRAAIIYAEDYNFYRHDGVDWGAIEDAVEANFERGSFAIGGSTITQQLAKNLYLSPSRSILRKLRELLIAYELEDHLSKQRILELYLNVVEWGDGVFGAEAAARHWFKRSAQSLTPAEAIRLACALPNPITRAPNMRSPELTKKGVRLTRLLRMQGLIDEVQERATLDELGAPHVPTLPSRRPAGKLPTAPVEPASIEPALVEPTAPPAAEPGTETETGPVTTPEPAPEAMPDPEPANAPEPVPAPE